jgi:acetate kinase
MNTFVLIPTAKAIEYSVYNEPGSPPLASGTLHAPSDGNDLDKIIRSVLSDLDQQSLDVAETCFVVRLPFCADAMDGPAIADDELLEALESLVPDAPLHLPRCIELIRECRLASAVAPVIVVSETSFFAGLPEEERVYAIDFGLSKEMRARRYGFHGIKHRHACRLVMGRCNATGTDGPPKIASICLEPRPELAAAIGQRPVMISGGMTPLEGLCGLTACGDIDPGIVLELARTKGWGADRINRCLGQESGMRGLTGRPMTWEELLNEDDQEVKPARDIFRHQLLRYCGAAASAMGGLDTIVFTGRGAAYASELGPWLAGKLGEATSTTPELIYCYIPLHELVHREADSLMCDTVGA